MKLTETSNANIHHSTWPFQLYIALALPSSQPCHLRVQTALEGASDKPTVTATEHGVNKTGDGDGDFISSTFRFCTGHSNSFSPLIIYTSQVQNARRWSRYKRAHKQRKGSGPSGKDEKRTTTVNKYHSMLETRGGFLN